MRLHCSDVQKPKPKKLNRVLETENRTESNRTEFEKSEPTSPTGPPSNTWFPGPARVPNPNGISTGSLIFAGITSVTDGQTD